MKPKQPILFILKDHETPMLFAGVWESWKSAEEPGNPLYTFTICTTTANDLVSDVHDRMPVILPAESWYAWLDAKTGPEELQAMLVPFDAGAMDRHKVTPLMNNARFEDPAAVDRYEIGAVDQEKPANSG